MKLVQHRDAMLPTYTYFYVNNDEKISSPYFDSEKEAEVWLASQWDSWKPARDL